MRISVHDIAQLQKSDRRLQIVDVRSPSEYSSGHIPGAVNVPMEEIESRLPDLERSSSVLLVCQGGNRAAIACELIAGQHLELLVLEGGTRSWVAAGLPIVSSRRTRWSLERQVRFGAGLIVLCGVILSLFVHPTWVYLAGFVGAGLVFAGATDLCLMAFLLAKMPWNRPALASDAGVSRQ